jgi:hypothetical protein
MERVTEEEKERAGVDAGVVLAVLAEANFLDLESSSASAVRYSAAERPDMDPVVDFFFWKEGDCMGLGILEATEGGEDTLAPVLCWVLFAQ